MSMIQTKSAVQHRMAETEQETPINRDRGRWIIPAVILALLTFEVVVNLATHGSGDATVESQTGFYGD